MAGTDQQPPRVVKHPADTGEARAPRPHGRGLGRDQSIAMVAFLLGGIAVVIQNWPMFWVSVALLVVS